MQRLLELLLRLLLWARKSLLPLLLRCRRQEDVLLLRTLDVAELNLLRQQFRFHRRRLLDGLRCRLLLLLLLDRELLQHRLLVRHLLQVLQRNLRVRMVQMDLLLHRDWPTGAHYVRHQGRSLLLLLLLLLLLWLH